MTGQPVRSKGQPVRSRPAPDRNAWRDAVWASKLPPLRRLTALCYAEHAGRSVDEVWVATSRGMERTGMSRTSWHDSRNDLEGRGWLRESCPSTPVASARYQLTLPQDDETK